MDLPINSMVIFHSYVSLPGGKSQNYLQIFIHVISQVVEAQKTSHAFEIRLWYFHIALEYFFWMGQTYCYHIWGKSINQLF